MLFDKEKEIEETARLLSDCHITGNGCEECLVPDICKEREYAIKLVEAGYGNIKQAIKKFEEKVYAELQYDIEIANRCYERTKHEHESKEKMLLAYEQGLHLGEVGGLVKARDLINSLLKKIYGEVEE